MPPISSRETQANKRWAALVSEDIDTAELVLDWSEYTADQWVEEIIADIKEGEYDDNLNVLRQALHNRFVTLDRPVPDLSVSSGDAAVIQVGRNYITNTHGSRSRWHGLIVRATEKSQTRWKCVVLKTGPYNRSTRRGTPIRVGQTVTIDPQLMEPWDQPVPEQCKGRYFSDGSHTDCPYEHDARPGEKECQECFNAVQARTAALDRQKQLQEEARLAEEAERKAEQAALDEIEARRKKRVEHKAKGRRRVQSRG